MREIKFRAWAKEEHEMIKAERLAFEEYMPLVDLLNDGDDLVIMQYTGLKDKNGREIYEGDIVKCYAREEWAIEAGIDSKLVFYGTGEIIWFKNECGFGIKGQDPTFLGWYECFEVIGNIYENPDLLTKQI